MLAGVAGMDFIMFVIAADAGIMPQTREHMEILSLLGHRRGLVALTRTDLAGPCGLSGVLEQVRRFVAGTFLADAPVFAVSSRTGEGVDALAVYLARVAASAARAAAGQTLGGRFRFCIDRVFTLKGRGIVVTGPVLSGALAAGAQVAVQPAGIYARVRSIHAQDMPAETATAGDRAALNLTGEKISLDVLKRGAMVVDPFLDRPTSRFDARIEILASGKKPLRQWFPMRFHHGAQDMAARLVFLEGESMAPGTGGLVQVVTEKPVMAMTGDRFIMRDTSAMRTLGGGRIIDPQAPQRKRRGAVRLQQLAAMEEEDSAQALRRLLHALPFAVDWDGFCKARNLDEETAQRILRHCNAAPLGGEDGLLLLHPQYYRSVRQAVMCTVEAFHQAEPDLPGIGLEKLRQETTAQLSPLYFRRLLAADISAGTLQIRGAWVALHTHEARLCEKDEQIWKKVEPVLMGEERFQPPRPRDFSRRFSVAEADMRRILKAAARMGYAYEVAQDYFFPRPVVHEIARIVQAIAAGRPKGEFAAADLRDRLENGRKVSILLLEFFDRHGLTIRMGNIRRFNPHRLCLFESCAADSADGTPAVRKMARENAPGSNASGRSA